jgi:hypothetical protein
LEQKFNYLIKINRIPRAHKYREFVLEIPGKKVPENIAFFPTGAFIVYACNDKLRRLPSRSEEINETSC